MEIYGKCFIGTVKAKKIFTHSLNFLFNCLFLHTEAAIGFSKSVYEIPEDRKAVVNVQVTNGSFDIPVTVR